jgi:hypothetical protein
LTIQSKQKSLIHGAFGLQKLTRNSVDIFKNDFINSSTAAVQVNLHCQKKKKKIVAEYLNGARERSNLDTSGGNHYCNIAYMKAWTRNINKNYEHISEQS